MHTLTRAVLVVLIAGCATNPVTGKREISLISESQEIEIGKQQLASAQQEMGFYSDQALQQYVSGVGHSMADVSERPNLPWEFHVVNDPAVNAFAAPGGFIFITRGILAYMNSEAELAGVVGHEIGHVTARHVASQLTQQTGLQGLLAVGSIIRPDLAQGAVGQLASAFAQLTLLKFSRDDESQADQLGHRYSLHQNYDVRQMPNTFRTLQRLAEASGSNTPAWQSTHPDPGDRVAKTQAWADTVTNPSRLHADRDRFLSHVDGLVFGADPQDGYFENNRFLHPQLKLQFDVPSGWQGGNQATQVIVVEPKGQAQVALTQAKQSSPEAAARAFAQQQGVQVIATQRASNGTITEFTATTQDNQQLHGAVLFSTVGGAAYQFMGLALATSWSSQSGNILNTLRSLRGTAANQQFKPRRFIRVVTLNSPTSVSALASQGGGAGTANEIALINGVPDNGTVSAGKAKTIAYR